MRNKKLASVGDLVDIRCNSNLVYSGTLTNITEKGIIIARGTSRFTINFSGIKIINNELFSMDKLAFA